VDQGSVQLEGHYARPGDTMRFGSLRRFLADGHGALRLEWTTWAEGDSDRIPETILLTGGRVYNREVPGAPWEELTGSPAFRARLQVLSGFPEVIAERGSAFGIETERAGGRVTAARAVRAHPRLGDVVDSVVYRYGEGAEPVAIGLTVHERDQVWSLEELRVSSRQTALPDSLFAPPREVARASLDPDSLSGEPAIAALAPGVWSVEMSDIDSRSLVVEFSDHLAVIEAAVSSANGERLVDAIRKRWPSKPIRYALVSHHHPHYVGGLRALIAEGATVVTTPGNEALMRRIADYPFRLRPDRLARSPRPLSLRTFDTRLELADSTNRLVAINIGDRSQHTAEFVVFWLPRAKLLFETELGWVTVNGTLRASRRAAKLLATLDEERVDVDRLVQSWPMRGTRAEVSRDELARMVAAQARPAGK
jgi:glyoxylase-like metal-dependent hydrolase (beta-lactamase superfamily II)